MQLEMRAELALADRLRAAITDLVQRVAEALAVAVLAAVGVVLVNTPANTPEHSIAGAKREPSSLVQLITSIGALVS